ncbi:hypothetical protein COB52_00800 [Candidatus Kaiserbacteria bacterium]|nr:MAG: hypothetical protein COB52_00800 [Candidatus Kaiserbacteria bacterium]
MKTITHKIRKYLGQYKYLQNFFEVLERTPRYAIHWYAMLVFGVLITLSTVVVAWVVFPRVALKVNEEIVITVDTVKASELQEVLDSYEIREIKFKRLKLNPTEITDPGR